jgi:hypothetical protein
MADQLVQELNRLGYQPVFLPRTGVSPPELYSYSRQNHRLVRYGELAAYLPAAGELKAKVGELGDINYQYSSRKKLDAAVSFLQNALQCIGISAIPKLKLEFAGSKDFSFAFTKVTYAAVTPAALAPLLGGMTTPGIAEKDIADGNLHIAYEYAYAMELLMSRGDRKEFAQGIEGHIGDFIDIGANGSVSVESKSTISFKGHGDPAAFAYKAGRLTRDAGQWTFRPEEVLKGFAAEPTAFLPQRDVVLAVDQKE